MRDPDEHPVAFDDLLGAAQAKTPQAELVALKAANGGLRLAYRLMTTKLWQHAKILYIVTRGLLVMAQQTGEAHPTAPGQSGVDPCCYTG